MTKYQIFERNLEHLQQEEDRLTGRVYNMDNFGHWLRVLSRRLTYVFYRAGLHGPHVLFAHFVFDLAALYFVYIQMPLAALVPWLVAHVLDNCDGDLARARGEAKPGWGQIDNLMHTWGNMIFWSVLGIVTGAWHLVATILAIRVVMEHHRSSYRTVGERYGERSRLWSWIVFPTDVTIMYLLYVPFALAGHLGWYLLGYLAYYLVAALGQGAAMIRKVVNS